MIQGSEERPFTQLTHGLCFLFIAKSIAKLRLLLLPQVDRPESLLEFNSKVYVSFSRSVPPLTQGNMLEAVKGVQNWVLLIRCFGVLSASSPEDVVEQFLLGRGFYQPSWRAVIFALDLMGETQIADHIRNHGEPVQGGCVFRLRTVTNEVMHSSLYGPVCCGIFFLKQNLGTHRN